MLGHSPNACRSQTEPHPGVPGVPVMVAGSQVLGPSPAVSQAGRRTETEIQSGAGLEPQTLQYGMSEGVLTSVFSVRHLPAALCVVIFPGRHQCHPQLVDVYLRD